MARISGVDFAFYQNLDGTTAGTGIADMVEKGVKFFIAKVGQATFFDSKWSVHRTKMLAQGAVIQKGGYWFLERDIPGEDVPGYFYPPVGNGLTYATSSYSYGYTTPTRGHNDFAVDFNLYPEDLGDPVRAIADGTVVDRDVGYYEGGFPNDPGWQASYGTIYINHSGGYRSQYTHMSDILVGGGDLVTRGQRIGSVGTKNANGPHLHHVHFKRASGGDPYVAVKMKFLGVAMTASRANTYAGRDNDNQRWTGQDVTGMPNPTGLAYTGIDQAEMFLEGLDPSGTPGNHDPTGWFCALDVEGAPSTQYGITPKWAQVRQFADEFWRQAPGYPLFLYTRKTFWNANIMNDAGNPADAKAYGLAGLWTADGTQIGTVWQSQFAAETADLSFEGTAATPYAGGYAGFQKSRIIQFGPLKVSANGEIRSLDGNAFNGTLAQLKAISVGTGESGGTVPNLNGLLEAAALTALTTAGMVAGVRTEAYHLSIAAGRVIRTDPPSGTTVDLGTSIDYVVSLGPLTGTIVPYLIDEEEAAFLASLTAVGLVAGTRTTATSLTIALGRVISTTPIAGTVVAAASSVAYVVSLGPPAVTAGFDPEPVSPCS